jgi:phosphate starvation-inducible PhoH-like protein
MSKHNFKNPKQNRDSRRKDRRNPEQAKPVVQNYSEKFNKKPFEPLNEAQGQYASQIAFKKVTFGIGSAGTGKSYVPIAMAAEQLRAGTINRIIIVRPLVDAEDGKVGTLPGEMEEKIEPYFQPAKSILSERLGAGQVQGLMKAGRIQFLPLAFLRGTTFKDCWIILDEGQNTTVSQMKMLLTRLGTGSKLIVNGDTRQVDLAPSKTSGLMDAVSRFKGHKSFGMQEFMQSDIVRGDFVKEVVVAYEGDDGSQAKKIELAA